MRAIRCGFLACLCALLQACSTTAPGFRLRDETEKERRLERLQRLGPLVVLFFRGHG